MQVEEFLERSARQFPEKTALVCQGQRFAYREIEEQCNRLAHALIALGIERGDRIAVYLDNSVEAVLSIFAISKAGAVFLVVYPTASFLAWVIRALARQLFKMYASFSALVVGLTIEKTAPAFRIAKIESTASTELSR